MKAQKAGFTLLEVILAICLIGTVITALLEFQAKGMDTVRETMDLTQATLISSQKIVEWERGRIPEEGGEGDFGEEYPDYRWQMNVEDTEITGLKKVSLVLTWRRGTRGRQLAIERLSFQRAAR